MRESVSMIYDRDTCNACRNWLVAMKKVTKNEVVEERMTLTELTILLDVTCSVVY